MQKDTFFITTPIYYTNGIPHIWHAYSSLICDTLARYQKINGQKVKFSTWVDENSQKAVLKAEEEGKEVMEHLDIMAEKHKAVWDGLEIKYTDFIRTTQQRHHKCVREVLQVSFDNKDIYQADYEWMYCIWCESFKKDDDLIEKNGVKVCPDHLTQPQYLKEKNYFFKLSKYQTWLEEFYEKNPSFVQPQERFNEVIAFVKRGLEDFSISRETNKFWIKLPFDEEQVTYVWYDALFNYVTVCNESDSGKDESDFWPANLHVVGKDIIRFHAIYWPAMLASAYHLWEEKDGVVHYKNTDLQKLPQNILTTWFFTVDGQKISKSLWNVIDPVEFSKKYSKDLLTLYLLSSFHIWQDGDFSEKQALLTYNAKLANNLGNLVNRVVVLALKIWGFLEKWKLRRYNGISMEWDKWEYNNKYFSIESDNILEKIDVLKYELSEDFERFNLKWILDESFKFLDTLNKFADEKEPWQTIKDETKLEETREVLYTIAEGLRQVWLALYPFFPEKMSEMFAKLGLEDYTEILEKGELQKLIEKTETFVIREKGEPLFLRFEV